MSEDDTADGNEDWFESALDGESADESTDDPSESEASDATSVDADRQDPIDTESETGTADPGGGARSDTDGTAQATADAETADESDEHADDTPFAGVSRSEGDSPFGDTGGDESDPFGTGESDPFADDDTDDESLFDDNFGEAMGSMGGDESGDFDDEALESNIPRLDLGIEGLDNMIQGGVPQRHLMVIIGGAGTGKTTFGLQFLQHGLTGEETEKGVFITLEQTHEDIMATANERGWEFERHEEEGNLAVIDLDPVEMANSLDNIRGELPQLIQEFDADRFVLDSVSLLEMMYDEQSRRRTEVFDFTQSLKNAGVTTVFTSEASEDNPYASRHGIIEYLTDAVFLLRYVRSETQETRLAVEIQKIRNANHSRETKPYDITLDGISVYEQANIF